MKTAKIIIKPIRFVVKKTIATLLSESKGIPQKPLDNIKPEKVERTNKNKR